MSQGAQQGAQKALQALLQWSTGTRSQTPSEGPRLQLVPKQWQRRQLRRRGLLRWLDMIPGYGWEAGGVLSDVIMKLYMSQKSVFGLMHLFAHLP